MMLEEELMKLLIKDKKMFIINLLKMLAQQRRVPIAYQDNFIDELDDDKRRLIREQRRNY